MCSVDLHVRADCFGVAEFSIFFAEFWEFWNFSEFPRFDKFYWIFQSERIAFVASLPVASHMGGSCP